MLPSRSIVILPVYNEEKSLERVLRGLADVGLSNILVVNDGSNDNSAEIAKNLGVCLISHSVNLGYGSALKTGFSHFLHDGRFEYAITFDGDGQMDPQDALRLLETAASTGSKFVYGLRTHQIGKAPPARVAVNFLADIFTSLLSGVYVKDTQSGLRCYHIDLIRRLKLSSSGFALASEAVIQSCRLGELPKPVLIESIYTKYSLAKGQKVTNSIKVALDLLK